MLASITPLGERSRGSRWWLTTTSYVVGSTLVGLAVGALLAAAGSVLVGWAETATRALILGGIVIAGLALELGVLGLQLPTVHRQVNEAWRFQYRGWVWGLGFGVQLGAGVVTIVTTSLIYATWIAAFLTASIPSGLLIGLLFGLARSAPVLTVARVRRSDQVFRVDGVMSRFAAPARRASVGAGAVLALCSLAVAARW